MPSGRKTDSRKVERIKEMLMSGWKAKQVSEELGVCENVVKQIRREMKDSYRENTTPSRTVGDFTKEWDFWRAYILGKCGHRRHKNMAFDTEGEDKK